MARLVALQLSVLQQNKQVINSDAKGVHTQMEELSFTEVRTVHIVTDRICCIVVVYLLQNTFLSLDRIHIICNSCTDHE